MLLVNNYNPYLMNTEILNYYNISPPLYSTPGMLLVNNYIQYLMNTEILKYYKYLASSIQDAWNVACKQLQPFPDEYRNLEFLNISRLLFTARLECYL